MKILITGGTGFVGTYLTTFLLNLGYGIVITGKSGKCKLKDNKNLKIICCDTKQPGPWQKEIESTDIIINLAGKNIFTFWTRKNLKEIWDSRLLTTKNIVDAIPHDTGKLLLSTSAAGFYGNRNQEILTEAAGMGSNHLSLLCDKWEKEAIKAEKKGCRVVCMRFGMVLGEGGGAMDMMLKPIKFFLGGILGKGENWVPWIHIEDLLHAILFCIDSANIKGPVNFAAPEQVSHKKFTYELANTLRRPVLFKIPALFVRTLIGPLGVELLSSQRIVPEKLKRYGFNFKFETIKAAFTDLVCNNKGHNEIV